MEEEMVQGSTTSICVFSHWLKLPMPQRWLHAPLGTHPPKCPKMSQALFQWLLSCGCPSVRRAHSWPWVIRSTATTAANCRRYGDIYGSLLPWLLFLGQLVKVKLAQICSSVRPIKVIIDFVVKVMHARCVVGGGSCLRQNVLFERYLRSFRVAADVGIVHHSSHFCFQGLEHS